MQQGSDTGASNVVYDLVSIQYHALKGAQVYDQYLRDAEQAGNRDIVDFITQVKEQDRQRALTVHRLLAQHTQATGQTIDLQDAQGQQDGQAAMAGAGAGAGTSGTTTG